MSSARSPAELSDEEYDARLLAPRQGGTGRLSLPSWEERLRAIQHAYPVHPGLQALAARTRATRQPAPWQGTRTIAELLFPQNAGDVAVEAATILPMPLPARVALAAGGLLLGNPSEAQGSPIDRIARHAAHAVARGAEGAEAAIARAAREGWGGQGRVPARVAEEGAETARLPSVGDNNPFPGPMPGQDVASPGSASPEAPTTTATSPTPTAPPQPATPPSQALPPEQPSGTVPEASRPRDTTPEPPPAGAASPNEPVGARPGDDLTPPRLIGSDREQAERLGQEILRARREERRLPPGQRLRSRPEDSVLADPRPGERLPGVAQRAADDLRAALSPDQRLLAGGQLPANPFSVVAENAGPIADRMLAGTDPVVLRVLRGEWVGPLSDRQRELVMAAQFSNMRPLYDRLAGLGFTPQGALDRTQQEARRLAATSPRSNTVTNLRSGALLGHQQVLLPPGASLADAVRSATGPGSGFHIIYGQHPQLLEAMLRGDASLARAPKTGSFARSLSGDFSAVPVDVHNFRAQNMIFNDLHPGQLPREAFRTGADYERYRAAYRSGPNGSPPLGMGDQDLRRLMVTAPPVRHVDGQALRDTYLIYNDITSEFARRAGITPTEAQGLMWVHYGGRTGLGSPARTATQILDDRISVTAQATGLSPLEVLSLYARYLIPLLGAAGIAGMGPLQGLLDPEKQARE